MDACCSIATLFWLSRRQMHLVLADEKKKIGILDYCG